MPSFQIPSDAKIFALGSCFARNIERALLNLGAQVTSAEPESDLMELKTNLNLGLLNKYNPVSIHQELEWAAGVYSFPEDGFVQLRGKYIDLYLRNQAPSGSIELVHNRRQKLKQYFARAFDADLVILTLGLTETWFDRQTRLALTETPSPRLRKQEPERFGLKLLAYPECLAVLQSICTLLKRYGQPSVKVVITISPVALERTYTDQDVIVANMMSKSTLRSAAGTLSSEVDGVDYFPSYEAAMISDPNLVWMGDRRNITDWMVTQIIKTFTQRYGITSVPTPEKQLIQAQEILKTRWKTTQNMLKQLSSK
ncbi:GSCFA domain-containing protein [Acaryochloris sp. CCMEE 5410]|uniref:GSCFA domain-containing protein n=1 Tax=Acaryochloris sp. CCMEE 5410 TaxID=310037 RepID=UPI0021D38C14|nr:GSCFA domain-containing protein [Acaryochloris sp. CCMEE 5410]KAI9129092.1 GSCFA domain-containing protein [Acaryochloris sp. CCMEE 5410]